MILGFFFGIVKFIYKALFSVFIAAVKAIWAAVKVIFKVAVAVVAAVSSAVMSAVGALLPGHKKWAHRHPLLDLMIFKHVHWSRLILGKEEHDEEVKRLREKFDDDDGNGIPDEYDREVTSPEQDFLRIKYPAPDELLRQNDYVRYLPRAINLWPQPVAMGAKGIVRSETILNAEGAFVMVKWNAFSPGGSKPSLPVFRVNQMDLTKLGHVHQSFRVTI